MIFPFPVEFSVSASSCIAAALMVLILPLPWLLAIVLAVAIHEICHLICLKVCRVCVYGIRIGLHGAAIETAAMSPFQELVCAAAGPMGSFLCLFFVRSFPMLAICGLFQGIYNLLPVYPLDGGRMLHAVAAGIAPMHADKICKIASHCTFAAIILGSLYLYFRTKGLFFLTLAGYFLLPSAICRKTPCKDRQY